ncbi:DMT family transporter [Desulfovibrio sp. OttesenSCG-928-C06]|nr:DMT family transporter [Desulfovibrio sp. OttesenSCG-928-C06]
MLSRIPKSHLYAALTVFLWGFSYVGTRIVMVENTFTAGNLGFIRNLTACVFFIVLLVVKKHGIPPLRDWPIFIAAGGIGFGYYLILFNKGMETLTGATSCIVLATAPLITALIASLSFREKLSVPAWLAMLLAFAGTAILALWEGTFNVEAGVFWTLAAAVFISIYNIIQRGLSRRYTSIQITAYSFITAIPLTIFLAPGAVGQFMEAPVLHQGVAVLMGIFPSALGYMFWAKALSVAANTSSVVNYMFLTPFIALILCFMILGELPNTGTFVGGAVILSGLWLFNTSMRRQREALAAQALQAAKLDEEKKPPLE